jgi:glucose/arabinose dehydrogenase
MLCPVVPAQVVMRRLNGPRGLASGPDGALYVSNRSDRAAAGEVLRIAP